VRQLIARIDDALHRRLKERAAAEGRSLNSLVAEILRAALGGDEPRARVEARLRASGLLVRLPRPARVPSLDDVVAATRGAGRTVSEALEAERRGR